MEKFQKTICTCDCCKHDHTGCTQSAKDFVSLLKAFYSRYRIEHGEAKAMDFMAAALVDAKLPDQVIRLMLPVITKF